MIVETERNQESNDFFGIEKDKKKVLSTTFIFSIITVAIVFAFNFVLIFPLAKIDNSQSIMKIFLSGRLVTSTNFSLNEILSPAAIAFYYLTIIVLNSSLVIRLYNETMNLSGKYKPRFYSKFALTQKILFIVGFSFAFISIMIFSLDILNLRLLLSGLQFTKLFYFLVVSMIFGLIAGIYNFTAKRHTYTEIRESAVFVRFEFKRIVLTLKYFIAMSFVLLPAIIFLNSIAKDFESLLLDFGMDAFRNYSTTSFVNIGQFLLQMIGIMLTLDSFGKEPDDSMRRYFALPIRRTNIYFAHTINAIVGTLIVGFLGIIVFDAILWIWTGVYLTFSLITKAFFLTAAGAILAISVTTFFVVAANFFNMSTTIAIVPTLFIFYIIPFLINFITQFAFGLPEAYKWTFMYHLAVATDIMIKPFIGLHQSVTIFANRLAWQVIGYVSGSTQFLSLIIFSNSEK